jgi:hypothetical protein
MPFTLTASIGLHRRLKGFIFSRGCLLTVLKFPSSERWMKPILSFGAALFLFTAPLRAEMIQGDGYSFFLSAPAGWVLDRTMAVDAEADVVLYPQGTTYQSAASVLTVSAAFKGEGFKDLGDLVRQDEEDSRQQNPDFSIRKGPVLQTRLEKRAVLFFTWD